MSTLKSVKFKSLPSVDHIKTPKLQPYLKVIPPTRTESFKEDVKEIKREIAGLKAGQTEIKHTLGDLKGVCEDLTRCDVELNSIISDLKVQEGSLKVFNYELRANIERLETVLKSTQAKVV